MLLSRVIVCFRWKRFSLTVLSGISAIKTEYPKLPLAYKRKLKSQFSTSLVLSRNCKTTSRILFFTTLSLVIRWQYPVTLVIPQSVFTFVISWPQSAFYPYKFRAQSPELSLFVTYPPFWYQSQVGR